MMCVSAWIVGAWRVLTDELPPMSPSRERVCVEYAAPGATQTGDTPDGLAAAGAPYWATWATEEHWPEPGTPRDGFPPCVDKDAAFASAKARHAAMWDAWWARNQDRALDWALNPLLASGGVLLAAGVVSAGARAKAAQRPAPASAALETVLAARRRRLQDDPTSPSTRIVRGRIHLIKKRV